MVSEWNPRNSRTSRNQTALEAFALLSIMPWYQAESPLADGAADSDLEAGALASIR